MKPKIKFFFSLAATHHQQQALILFAIKPCVLSIQPMKNLSIFFQYFQSRQLFIASANTKNGGILFQTPTLLIFNLRSYTSDIIHHSTEKDMSNYLL